jgi:hypothetical protein
MPTGLADGLGLRDAPLVYISIIRKRANKQDTPQEWFPRSSFSFTYVWVPLYP